MATRVKIRDADSRMVKDKAVYVAFGLTRDGQREGLGLWIAESGRGHKTVRGIVLPDHGARFRLSVMNEPTNIRHCRSDQWRAMAHHAGHPDRGRGRAERLPGSHHGRLPAGHGPARGSARSGLD